MKKSTRLCFVSVFSIMFLQMCAMDREGASLQARRGLARSLQVAVERVVVEQSAYGLQRVLSEHEFSPRLLGESLASIRNTQAFYRENQIDPPAFLAQAITLLMRHGAPGEE